MPTISRFFGVVIAMFFDDHGPPHFHARHADGSAKVRIDTLEVLESTLGRRQLRLSFTTMRCARIGAVRGSVRHWSRSRRCDDRPDP